MGISILIFLTRATASSQKFNRFERRESGRESFASKGFEEEETDSLTLDLRQNFKILKSC
jgi:hypothetical protein